MISTIKKAGYGVAAATLLLPAVVLAQTQQPQGARGLEQALQTAGELLNMVVPLLIGAAVIVFLWGVLQYVTKAGGDQKGAINTMLWGIVAIAVMVSVWGLVGILRDTLGISNQNEQIPVPNLPPVESRR